MVPKPPPPDFRFRSVLSTATGHFFLSEIAPPKPPEFRPPARPPQAVTAGGPQPFSAAGYLKPAMKWVHGVVGDYNDKACELRSRVFVQLQLALESLIPKP